MMEVTVPRSIFGRPRSQRDRRSQKLMTEMLEREGNNIGSLSHFKVEPGVHCMPDPTPTRPIPLCCKYCLPESQVMVAEDVKYLGLQDCFLPSTISPHNKFLTRLFPFYFHYLKNCNSVRFHRLPTFQQLENDDNLLTLYPEEMFDTVGLLAKTRDAVLNTIRMMEAKNVWGFLRKSLIRFTAWAYKIYFSYRFASVLVHGAQIEVLKTVLATSLPVVYIPTYRSKLDTSIILWTLTHHGISPPLFLMGHQTNHKLAKYFGGIGSSVSSTPGEKHRELRYSAAFSVYLRNILRNGNSLMFHLESRRTRTGRPSAATYGTEILRIIHDEFLKGKLEDVYFVPISISYESLPDHDLFSDTALNKVPTNLFKRLLGKVLETFTGPKGIVKLDFAQPFCLREFGRSARSLPKMTRLLSGGLENYSTSRDCAYLRWNSTESVNSVTSMYGELYPLYPDADDERNQAKLLDMLNYHLIHDAGKCESIMPTHLVAFLLMKKFRRGATLDKLIIELEWLIDYLKRIKKDFGFMLHECDGESIISRAIELMRSDVIVTRVDETYKIEPNDNLKSLRKLDYYANYILPEFMMTAVIATAIFVMHGTQLVVLRGFDIELEVHDQELMNHCRRIYEVLTAGFFLHPPCITGEAAIRNKMMDLFDNGHLILIMRSTHARCFDEQFDDDDFEVDIRQMDIAGDVNFTPDTVKIRTSEQTFKLLDFCRNLLVPYLDLYGFLSTSLKILLDGDTCDETIEMKQEDLKNHLLKKIVEESENYFSYCRELLNMDIVKSFLVTCEDHGVIYSRIDGKTCVRYYGLEQNFASFDELDKLASGITSYVTK